MCAVSPHRRAPTTARCVALCFAVLLCCAAVCCDALRCAVQVLLFPAMKPQAAGGAGPEESSGTKDMSVVVSLGGASYLLHPRRISASNVSVQTFLWGTVADILCSRLFQATCKQCSLLGAAAYLLLERPQHGLA